MMDGIGADRRETTGMIKGAEKGEGILGCIPGKLASTNSEDISCRCKEVRRADGQVA